jgi:hypothetical protein
MKSVWKWSVLLVLALAGAVIWGVYTRAPYPGHPTLASNMLYKYSNPVPGPKLVQIYTTAKEGEGEPSRNKPRRKWLRFESQDEVVIASLVTAMREGTQRDRLHPPLNDVVTYHIYFESAESTLPLYYMFYYRKATNEPSALSAYTTVGNLCNAEAVERWFETNGLLPGTENQHRSE